MLSQKNMLDSSAIKTYSFFPPKKRTWSEWLRLLLRSIHLRDSFGYNDNTWYSKVLLNDRSDNMTIYKLGPLFLVPLYKSMVVGLDNATVTLLRILAPMTCLLPFWGPLMRPLLQFYKSPPHCLHCITSSTLQQKSEQAMVRTK